MSLPGSSSQDKLWEGEEEMKEEERGGSSFPPTGSTTSPPQPDLMLQPTKLEGCWGEGEDGGGE